MPSGNANRALGLQIVDPVLTNLARRYQAQGFIYEQLVARQPVSQLTGIYPVFDRRYWTGLATDPETKDRAPAREVDFSWDVETFIAKEYALKVSITQLERDQANPALRLEQSKNDFLSQQMYIAREKRLATLLSDPAVTTGGGLTSGNSAAIGTKWDTATSNPEADVRAGVLAIYNAIGYTPNVVVIPYPVAYYLATQHGTDTFRGQIIYTGDVEQDLSQAPGSILPPMLWGMRVVIPMGVQDTTAHEGAASPTYNETWGKDVRLLRVDPGAPWGSPSVVYALQHTPLTTERWDQKDPDITYIRQNERVAEKVVAPDAGYVLRAAIS